MKTSKPKRMDSEEIIFRIEVFFSQSRIHWENLKDKIHNSEFSKHKKNTR